MLRVRKAGERGHADHGWLDSWHTFSFAEYHDPEHMGFRGLRVINEDVVAPGQGFGMHPHRDMEIVTLVLSGALEHKDSLGNGEVLRPGELQRMTAGSGILHSEFNPSDREPVHLYQIWIKPSQKGLTPSYEQRAFDPAARRNRLQLVAAPAGTEVSGEVLAIQTDARLYLGALDAGTELSLDLSPDRHAWVQILNGQAQVNDQTLVAGDAMALSNETRVALQGVTAAELLLFDLA